MLFDQLTADQFSNIMSESVNNETEDKAGMRLNHAYHPEHKEITIIQGCRDEIPIDQG